MDKDEFYLDSLKWDNRELGADERFVEVVPRSSLKENPQWSDTAVDMLAECY